jgi:hypothetical protein
VREVSKFKDLQKGLGERPPTELQYVLGTSPKPSPSAATEKPELIVDFGDLPATARAVRDFLAVSGILFDRGVPVKVVKPTDGGPPIAERLTANRVVIEAHQLCRPVKPQGDDLVTVTLPNRVARMTKRGFCFLSESFGAPPPTSSRRPRSSAFAAAFAYFLK